MKKHIFHLSWVLAFVLFTVGCGGSDDPAARPDDMKDPMMEPGDSMEPAEKPADELAEEPTDEPAGPPASVRIVSTHESDIPSSLRDIPGGSVSIGSYKVYMGEYNVTGLPPLRYALGVRADAPLDRMFVEINGGTGTPIEFLIEERFPDGTHKAFLIIGQRGMSDQDRETRCALGSGLIQCLKEHKTLRTFNPRQNGEDVNRLIGIIQKSDELKDVLSRPEGPVDLITGSYGATILGYSLTNTRYPPPAMRNVIINGPSEPNELVITSGIGNSKRFLAGLLSYRASVQPSATPYSIEDLAAELAANPGRHIGDLFDEMYNEWEKPDIVGGPSNAVALMNRFIDARDKSSFYGTDWDTGYKIDLIGSGLDDFGLMPDDERDFTSRIGHICSSYINRANDPDSSARYKAALEAPDGVFRYGFLNKYRDMLTICPQIADATERLTAPSGAGSVNAYALVVYGGAMDDKHYPGEVDAMLAYFGDSTRKYRLVEQYNNQGGGVKGMCFPTAMRSLLQNDDGTIDRSDCSQ